MNFPMKWLFNRKPVLEVCGRTDCGRIRENNEDSFAILQDRSLFMVADGMGGHQAGEVASSMAIEKTATLCSPKELTARQGNKPALQHFLIETFHTVNAHVSKAAAREERKGMGCTLTVALIDRDTLHCCHVGDSRCYVFGEDEFKQITTDHVACMPDEVTAASPSMSKCNALTRIIGYPLSDDPQYTTVSLCQGDRILLCTDGLWSMLNDSEMQDIIRSAPTPDHCCDRLIDGANAAGGRDNITAVAIFVK